MPVAVRRRRGAAEGRSALPEELVRQRGRFMAFLRIECGLSENTLEAYGRDLDDLLTDLAGQGIHLLGSASSRVLSSHIVGLKTGRGLSGTSVIRHLATIKVFFRWALAQSLIEKDPTDILDRPTRWKKLPDVLSPRDMRV